MSELSREKPSFDASGIVLVNKPVGISSNKVVGIVKHSLGAKKCGHLGTLDLEGEGLLPVTVNAATKLFDLFLKKNKTYVATFQFGIETDTLDLSGKVLKEKPCNITKQRLEEVCKQSLGKQMQMPPMFSAKKVGGKVAYQEARKGRTLNLVPKEIEIFSLEVLKQKAPNVFEMKICCSAGTYVRCIARDLAEKMSTYGIMQCITRTKCGDFDLKDAFSLDDIKQGNFTLEKCEDVLWFDSIFLDLQEEKRLLFGQQIDCKKPDGTYKIFGKQFLGVGSVKAQKLQLDIRLF